MRITVCGHSMINPRQYMLFEYMGASNLAEVQVLAPSRWGSERCETVHKENYSLEGLEPIGQSFLNFRLRGLEDHIEEFYPDVLYVMEEPYTPFALRCSLIAEKYNIHMAVFTWENIIDKSFGKRYDKIESGVLDSANIVVAGNEGAKARLLHKGVAEDKIAVCPQTGIATGIFKPMPEVEKTYDLSYFGRMVKEKGIEYIEKVSKELNLKMLWIGGRGGVTPSYGDYIRWVDYLNLPEYYNKAKLFVTYPYAFEGYSEQFNYSIGEALACGTLVVTSLNGSIGEVYNDAPIVYAEEANTKLLKDSIKYALDKYRRAERGIKWVRDNLSMEVIAQRLLGILKGGKK